MHTITEYCNSRFCVVTAPSFVVASAPSLASAWSGALTLDHTGEQTDTDFGTYQDVTLDAYTLVGGQLRWQAGGGVELYARGENLLDEEYQDVFGYHSPGRGLYLGLRLRHG